LACAIVAVLRKTVVCPSFRFFRVDPTHDTLLADNTPID